jgi:hypothetical protein
MSRFSPPRRSRILSVAATHLATLRIEGPKNRRCYTDCSGCTLGSDRLGKILSITHRTPITGKITKTSPQTRTLVKSRDILSRPDFMALNQIIRNLVWEPYRVSFNPTVLARNGVPLIRSAVTLLTFLAAIVDRHSRLQCPGPSRQRRGMETGCSTSPVWESLGFSTEAQGVSAKSVQNRLWRGRSHRPATVRSRYCY